jgi:hypothetical protein
MCVTSNFGDLSASKASTATCRDSIFRAIDRMRVSSASCSADGLYGRLLQSR